MPTMPINLKKGDLCNGMPVLEVINAAAGEYVLGSTMDAQLADLKQRLLTAENIIGKRIAVRLNRQPTNQDLYELGTVWEDVSFGDTTPLRLITTAPGVWVFQNQISITKFRFFVRGDRSTYRSKIWAVQFFRKDGTQIPNNHFVWGASSGISGAGAGAAYTGQEIYAGYNASGWVDIEVSGLFDFSTQVSRIAGYFNYDANGSLETCTGIEAWYSNGSRKVYSGPGFKSGTSDMLVADPPVLCRYGDSVAAAQGEMLTAGKLSDANSNDYGRVSGAAFCSAVHVLMSGLEARVKALEPPKVLAVSIQHGFPSADQSMATLTPPDGKTFKPGGLYGMLNRIAPDLAEISQGSGGTDTYNFTTPTTPGTYMLILQPQYTDGTSGDIRETFIIK